MEMCLYGRSGGLQARQTPRCTQKGAVHHGPSPPSPAALCLGHSCRDLPHRRDDGRGHRRARRAHPSAGSRLWLGSRGDCARGLHQRLPLWPGRTLRRAGDAARRPAARDADQSAPHCRRRRRLNAGPDLAPPLSPLGRRGRRGDGEYGPRAQRRRWSIAGSPPSGAWPSGCWAPRVPRDGWCFCPCSPRS